MRINSPRAVYYERTVVACTTKHKTCNSYLKDSNVVTHVLGSLSSRFSFWPGYRKLTIWTVCVIGNSRCVLTFSTAVMSLVRTWEREREYNMVTWSGFYTKQVIKLLPEDENIQSPLQSKPRFKWLSKHTINLSSLMLCKQMNKQRRSNYRTSRCNILSPRK